MSITVIRTTKYLKRHSLVIKMKIIRNNSIFLLIFITIFIFLGAGKAFDHQLNHPSPTGFMASDAYTHNWVAQNTYDTGYINQPPIYSFDNNQDYNQKVDDYKLFHPPILPLLTASMARLSGSEVFDVNITLVFLLISLLIALNYFILARFNSLLALFSLPFTLLFLKGKFFISLSWGWWDFITGEFFLLAVILLLLNEKFSFRYFFNALLITVAFMAHGVEAIYAAIFISFYLIYIFLNKRKELFPFIIEQLKSLPLVLLIGGYSIIIFLKTMGQMGYSHLRMMTHSQFLTKIYEGSAPNFFIYFNEFGIYFKILIIIGILIFGYLLFKKKNNPNSNLFPYYLFVVFMSLSPYLYIMAGERGFQWRFLWPVYLSLAFGSICLVIYLVLKKIIQNRTLLKTIIFSAGTITLIVMVLPLPFSGAGLIDAVDYESYKWVHENTEPFSDILVLFSPINDQISRLYLLKRDLFISTSENWQLMNTDNSLLINLKDDWRRDFFCKKSDCSLFQESHFMESERRQRDNYFKNISICSFDYIYVTFKNQQEIHNKNAGYLNYLISKNITQPVFNNAGAVITKNIVKGEECENRFRD